MGITWEITVRFAPVEQRKDVRMVEIGGGLDLAQEALRAKHRGEFGPQDFHRHPAMVLQILRKVDRSHTPSADLPLDCVAVG